MRFRRRTKLFPGFYINFSKTGISTTLGVPGASVNFNKQGAFLNTGIPGTGLYDRKRLSGRKNPTSGLPFNNPSANITFANEQFIEIKSEEAEGTTTEGLLELKKTLSDCYQERNELEMEIAKVKSKTLIAFFLMILSYIFILGFFLKWFKENEKSFQKYLNELKEQYKACTVSIDINVPEEIDNKYSILIETYRGLLTCDRIWDITSTASVDQKNNRSGASKTVDRRIVTFSFSKIDIIQSRYEVMHLENANGGDLYIYPAFVALVDAKKKFGLIDIGELEFNFYGQRFIEEKKVPKDATIKDYTWAKVNKNGSPDKRFKSNYQIPVCKYGYMELKSSTGLNESYSFSSYEKMEKFEQAVLEYQKIIKIPTLI